MGRGPKQLNAPTPPLLVEEGGDVTLAVTDSEDARPAGPGQFASEPDGVGQAIDPALRPDFPQAPVSLLSVALSNSQRKTPSGRPRPLTAMVAYRWSRASRFRSGCGR